MPCRCPRVLLKVRTDSGWVRYDDEAQTALRAAAEKGQPECRWAALIPRILCREPPRNVNLWACIQGEIFAQGQYYKISLKRLSAEAGFEMERRLELSTGFSRNGADQSFDRKRAVGALAGRGPADS